MTGKVYLVGAGPGDPGLLTMKAKRCLEQADAVVYDRLVAPRILNFVPASATFIYVGKAAGDHTMPQEQIEETLVELAQSGKTVVRLKGGDPFVYGRGGEEGVTLTEHGVEWEVVPGVTSAISVPAYAGIPLTHRHVATSFTVVTGHECVSSDPTQAVAWDEIAHRQGTCVIMMGVNELSSIVYRLLRAGRSVDTPVALVRWGTRADQQTVTGTLGTIVSIVKAANFLPPAVIVVGDVVKLRESLAWREQQSHFGKKVLVISDTIREAEQESEKIEANGGEVFDFALERQMMNTPDVFAALHRSIADGRRSFIYFTTVLGVRAFVKYLRDVHLDARRLAQLYIGVATDGIGNELSVAGMQADYVGSIVQNTHHRTVEYVAQWVESTLAEQSPQSQVRDDLQGGDGPLLLYEVTPIQSVAAIHKTFSKLSDALGGIELSVTQFYQLEQQSPAIDALKRSWNLATVDEVQNSSEFALHVFQQMLHPLQLSSIESRPELAVMTR